ncbi:MAG TPA: hypothetical protein VMB91_10755 [Solirubrobacteraceae bacterium]|nr:hypothetical protein [Solirubrobacteraceae bacterium]
MRTPKPSPALIVAGAALFVALGGTAIAAGQYVINSTAQIKPNVLKTLTGTPGRYLEEVSQEVTVGPGKPGFASATCPTAGELQNGPLTSRSAYHIVTGGYVADLAPGASVASDRPLGATGWSVSVTNVASGGTSHFRAFALCAPGNASSAGPGFWSVR